MNGNLSPDDIDALVRTTATEANDPDGQLAVANVALNRLAAGNYGPNVAAVVTAPGQFEPWQNGRAQRLDARSPQYRQAAQVVNDALAGQVPDPTGGATHFFSPKSQAALGRSAPSWAQGPALAYVGGNAYFAPHGAVMRQQKQSEPGVDVDGLVAQWGGTANAGQGAASAPSPATSVPGNPGKAAGGQNMGPSGDVDVDALVNMWGGGDAAAAGEHVLTVKGAGASPFGTLDGVKIGQQPAAQQPGNAGMAAGRGAIEGIPIVGPYLAAGLDRGIAAERSIHEDVPYSQALREVQDFAGATDAAHPYASTAGKVAGGVAAFGGLGATEAGAAALGLRGGSMLMRGAIGGGANAAIGGADAYVRSGGDDDATRTGAALGATFGLLGPVVGSAAGAGGNALSRYFEGFRPSVAAPNRLLAAVQGTGGDLPMMAQRLSDNPGLSLMDVNPGARDLAQGLAAQAGDARDTLVRAYGQRAAGARDTVTGAYDAAMGPTPDVLATLDGIRQTAARNGRQGFGAALASARPVDTSAAIQALDAQIRPGVNGIVSPGSNIPLSAVQQRLQQIRGLLTTEDGSEVLTDPNRLHRIQSDLGVEGRTLLASSSGSDRLMGRAVMDARSNIVDALDDATSGAFKPAQQRYASDMAVQDAFTKGMSIFQNRGGANGLEDRPEFWRQTVAQASPDERQALILGARTAADNAMQGVRNAALKGETIPQIGANLDKLRAVLGDDQANTLAQRMRDARDMAATDARLFEGSQTQPRQANKLAVAVREPSALAMEVGLPGFAAMTGNPLTAAALGGAALARRGLQVAGRAADYSRNNLLADAITATGPAAQEQINSLIALAGQQGLANAATGSGAALGAAFQGVPVDYSRLRGKPVTGREIGNRLLRSGQGR